MPILVAGILVYAFTVRFYRTKLGLPYIYYYDEPQTASTALNILKTGDFDPHFFNYGSLMIYLNVAVDVLHYVYLAGQPETAEAYIRKPKDIVTGSDTNWHWTISHPSFYRWNRTLTAILGTGAVLAAFFLGRILGGKWIGLVSSLFLASLPVHVKFSAIVSPDVPAGFFVAYAVLFAVLFFRQGRTSMLVASLVFCGLSAATKYNAAMSWFAPAAALCCARAKDRKSVRPYFWLLLFAVPFIVFLVTTPYALFSFNHFIANLGSEVTHYKVRGHGAATIEPGWEHIRFQLAEFYRHIGPIPSVLAVLGFLGLFRRRIAGLLVFLVPVVYLLCMTRMKVNFHRNFLLVYPFVALLVGMGFSVLESILSFAARKLGWRPKAVLLVIPVLAALILLPQVCSSWILARKQWNAVDSRTKAVVEASRIAKANRYSKIVIAEEFRVHQQDLRRITVPYSVEPLDMENGTWEQEGNLYLLPRSVFVRRLGDDEKLEKKAEAYNKRIQTVKQRILRKYGDGPLPLDQKLPIANPRILLVGARPIQRDD